MIDANDIRSFPESIKELFDERTSNCSYYRSRKYDEIHEKEEEMHKRIKRKIGKKKYRQLWHEFFGLDECHGLEMGEIQDSAYRRGFVDALYLAGEVQRGMQGLPTIFSGEERLN